MEKALLGGLLKRQPNSAYGSKGDKLYSAINDAGTEALTKGSRVWYRQVGGTCIRQGYLIQHRELQTMCAANMQKCTRCFFCFLCKLALFR